MNDCDSSNCFFIIKCHLIGFMKYNQLLKRQESNWNVKKKVWNHRRATKLIIDVFKWCRIQNLEIVIRTEYMKMYVNVAFWFEIIIATQSTELNL